VGTSVIFVYVACAFVKWLIAEKFLESKNQAGKKMNTDPIADIIARIKNAWLIRKKVVKAPYSNQKVALLKIFKEKGIIADFKIEGEARKEFVIFLSYLEDGSAPAENIIRVSKSGRRLYTGHKDIHAVRSGYGFSIISTSQGIMLGHEAKKRNLGGEIICKVV